MLLWAARNQRALVTLMQFCCSRFMCFPNHLSRSYRKSGVRAHGDAARPMVNRESFAYLRAVPAIGFDETASAQRLARHPENTPQPAGASPGRTSCSTTASTAGQFVKSWSRDVSVDAPCFRAIRFMTNRTRKLYRV